MTNSFPEIVLVQMPWADTETPSIALGILSSICYEEEIKAKTLYPNLDLIQIIGYEAIYRFSHERCLYGLSEHLFAVDIFGAEALHSDTYLEKFHSIMQRDPIIEEWKIPIKELQYLVELRDCIIPEFLNRVEKRILQLSPRIVGFTATFNQVMSSLAMAKRIKKLCPDIIVVAGGASFDDDMGIEYHRAFNDCLDHVFLGEAEESFREFVIRIRDGKSTTGIPGITYYNGERIDYQKGEPLSDLNKSPIPDYMDFFSEVDRIKQETGKVLKISRLGFESSRGCWWGRKSQCFFCGINSELLQFRPKDVDRVIEDIMTLSARYGINKLFATDLIISREHVDDFCTKMKELDYDIELFYEIRVDMTKEQLKNLKDAGVCRVQPGIESFSTAVLKRMRKGTTVLKNIQFLRWAAEIGLETVYNLLAGFPDEEPGWYFEMAQIIPKIYHLNPPKQNVQMIEMHRFSPFYVEHGLTQKDECFVRADYCYNYPDQMVDLLKTGYFFHTLYEAANPNREHIKKVKEAVEPWIEKRANHMLPTFNYAIGPGYLKVTDMRDDKGRFITLRDLYQDILLLCDQIQHREVLKRDLARKRPDDVGSGLVDRAINELLEKDLLISEGNMLLTLPIGVKYRSTDELRNYVLG
ncbi:MAG: RiPP maturation radical SAM C-methyltransferase [Bacillota bacterium]